MDGEMTKLYSQKFKEKLINFIDNFSSIKEEKNKEGENLTFMNSKILFRKEAEAINEIIKDKGFKKGLI